MQCCTGLLTAVLNGLSRHTRSAPVAAAAAALANPLARPLHTRLPPPTTFSITASSFHNAGCLVPSTLPAVQLRTPTLLPVQKLHTSRITAKKKKQQQRGQAATTTSTTACGAAGISSSDGDNDGDGGGGEPVAVEEWDGRVPRSRIVVTASRSSGAGGQNVNKVSTKAELRFTVDTADWLPEYGRNRLKLAEHGRITKDGEFIITSQKTRSLKKNTDHAFEMLRQFCVVAMQVPKTTSPEKKARVVKLAKQSNERRLREKKFRSEKLKQRRGGGSKKDGW